MLLFKIIDALTARKVRYGLVGGYAVALHGAVRGTLDIDLVLPFSSRQFELAEAAFKDIGLQPRLPVTAKEVFMFREEYIKNRNMIAWSFVNFGNPAELVDVILSDDLRQMKTKRISVRGKSIRVVAIADLIRMKRRSGRPQDLADIAALEKLQ